MFLLFLWGYKLELQQQEHTGLREGVSSWVNGRFWKLWGPKKNRLALTGWLRPIRWGLFVNANGAKRLVLMSWEVTTVPETSSEPAMLYGAGTKKQQNNPAKQEKEKRWLKLHFPSSGFCRRFVLISCILEHMCRAGGLFCTCSAADDDAAWHIACREHSYRAA